MECKIGTGCTPTPEFCEHVMRIYCCVNQFALNAFHLIRNSQTTSFGCQIVNICCLTENNKFANVRCSSQASMSAFIQILFTYYSPF